MAEVREDDHVFLQLPQLGLPMLGSLASIEVTESRPSRQVVPLSVVLLMDLHVFAN